MPIRIKEIFKSDLDPNSDNWWAKDKVDKLNYNFNELANGGMPGPQGIRGTDGKTGEQGGQGFEGFEGPFGPQGVQGVDGLSFWRRHFGGNNDTITTNKLSSPELSAVPVILGAIGGSDIYDESISYFTSVLTMNQVYSQRLGFMRDAISLTYSMEERGSSANTWNIFFDEDEDSTLILGKHFLSGQDNSLSRIFSTIDLTTTNKINLASIDTDDDGIATGNLNDLLKIEYSSLGDQYLQVLTPSIFKSNLTTNELTYKDADVEVENVLISLDSDGTTQWVNKADYFGALPVGSIVSIREEDFTDQFFHITDAAITNTNDGLLRFIYGRGKLGEKYEGFYLANGMNWNLEGIISFDVPNLNSFDYEVVGSGEPNDNQLSGTGGSDEAIVIAGADADLQITYNSTDNNFNSSTTVDTDDHTIYMSNGTSNVQVNRQIHIVNLGETNLYWQTGSGSVAATPNSIISRGTTEFDACNSDTHISSQLINADYDDWIDSNNNLSAVYFLDSSNNSMPSGWYGVAEDSNSQFSDVIRYWDGTAFTQVTECQQYTDILLKYDANIINLNGIHSTGGTTYKTDEPIWEDATLLLENNGNAAALGWYKPITGNANETRRFWNGQYFYGEEISDEYVYKIETKTYGSTSLNEPCLNLSNSFDSYFTSDIVYLPSVRTLSDVYSGTHTVYVNYAYSGGSTGTKAVQKIYDVNVPGGSAAYKYIIDEDSNGDIRESAAILTTSTINEPISCVFPNTIVAALTTSHPLGLNVDRSDLDTVGSTSSNWKGKGTITIYTAPQLVELKAAAHGLINFNGINENGNNLNTIPDEAKATLKIKDSSGTMIGQVSVEVVGNANTTGGAAIALTEDAEVINLTNTGVYSYDLTVHYIIGGGTIDLGFTT